MNRFRQGTLAAGLALLLAGCYVPEPSTHVALEIAGDGTFVLGGVAVAPDALQSAFAAQREKTPAVLIEIRASAQTDQAAINTAVAAAKAAGVGFAFNHAPASR